MRIMRRTRTTAVPIIISIIGLNIFFDAIIEVRLNNAKTHIIDDLCFFRHFDLPFLLLNYS